MEARLDYSKASPEAYKAMVQMEGVVRRSGIDPKLLELMKIRASQLNGCAYCIDMHTKDARFRAAQHHTTESGHALCLLDRGIPNISSNISAASWA
jgi:AhpD family alkylhydroperoxidase